MPPEVLNAIVAEVGADRVGLRVGPGHTFNGIDEDDMEAPYTHYLSEMSGLGSSIFKLSGRFPTRQKAMLWRYRSLLVRAR